MAENGHGQILFKETGVFSVRTYNGYFPGATCWLVGMKTSLAIILALLVSACGLMPPPKVSVEPDLIAPATICGDSSNVIAIVFFDVIDANVIAVGGHLIPSFQQKKRNLIGIPTIPSLHSYCVSVSAGEHKITLLAERTRGIGSYSGTSYYIGECKVQLASHRKYIVVPARSNNSYNKLLVQLKELNVKEPATICELSELPRDALFELLEKMRH